MLIFVYNADSGLFNTVAGIAHKLISPQTYPCNLCALTHAPFGVRKEWTAFLQTLGRPLEFLHADEFRSRFDIHGVPLPAIFTQVDGRVEVWMDASAINQCKSLDALQQAITRRMQPA